MAKKAVRAQREVEWVAEHLSQKRVTQKSAPSMVAWNMWSDLKDMKPTERARLFWIGMYAKLLPTKQQIERQSEIDDDDRDLTGSIDKYLEEAQAAEEEEADLGAVGEGTDAALPEGSEERGEESGLPKKGDEGRDGE